MLNIKDKIFTTTEAQQYLKDTKDSHPETKCYSQLFYLDFVNNFLTIKEMSEVYYMSKTEATNWITVGRLTNWDESQTKQKEMK